MTFSPEGKHDEAIMAETSALSNDTCSTVGSTFQAAEGARIFTKLEVEGPVLVRASGGHLPTGVPISMQIDIADAILKLRQEVAALKTAIAAGQDNWRWCQKCEGLFFAGHGTHGKCPADGQAHSLQGSGNYRLVTA
jgi:hypothetical protein